MKIGVDVRFLENDLYSRFVVQLLNEMFIQRNETRFILYTNWKNEHFHTLQNVTIKQVNIPLGSLKEQTKFKSILTIDKNNLVLFFSHSKPVFYRNDYITVVGSLKDIYYSDFPSNLSKSKYLYLAEQNYKKSKKIICLDEKTKHELIERFDIHEHKIHIIDWFFPHEKSYEEEVSFGEKPLHIRSKYGLTKDFFIYSGGNSIEKNYEKLVSVFSKMQKKWYHFDLVFLGNTVAKNVNLRNNILEKNMQESVHFLGNPDINDKRKLYKESTGVVLPSFYEPFPFRLTEPLYFETPLITSNLPKIKKIFWEQITYFSPISENSIIEALEVFLKNQNKAIDYSHIKEKYTVKNTATSFIEILNKS